MQNNNHTTKLGNVSILGAGSMGTALAFCIQNNVSCLVLWSIEDDVVSDINKNHENSKYLRRFRLSKNVIATGDLKFAVSKSDVVVISTKSDAVKSVSRKIKNLIKPNAILVNTAKGLDKNSAKTMIDVITESTQHKYTVVLSGPSLANEFVAGSKTVFVIATRYRDVFRKLRGVFANRNFILTYSDDPVGVSLGGSIKNIYAIALGMCDGMRARLNTKAIIVVQALNEMKQIARIYKCKEETIDGFCGLGDLIATGFSEHSRNRAFGEAIASGKKVDNLRTLTIEGIQTCKTLYKHLRKKNLKLPLLEMIYNVTIKNKNPKEEIVDFFNCLNE